MTESVKWKHVYLLIERLQQIFFYDFWNAAYSPSVVGFYLRIHKWEPTRWADCIKKKCCSLLVGECTRTGKNGVPWRSARGAAYSYQSAHVRVTRNAEETKSAKGENSGGGEGALRYSVLSAKRMIEKENVIEPDGGSRFFRCHTFVTSTSEIPRCLSLANIHNNIFIIHKML